ncbi:MAG: hypothetical protein O8C61_09100 [Candidatus Methanoperedens sp.]|nr:hypothetical protein [Candidatus Methanoperedens sp.]
METYLSKCCIAPIAVTEDDEEDYCSSCQTFNPEIFNPEIKKKRAQLDEIDKKFARESKLKAEIVANILHCSVGDVKYHKNRGIWDKRKLSPKQIQLYD